MNIIRTQTPLAGLRAAVAPAARLVRRARIWWLRLQLAELDDRERRGAAMVAMDEAYSRELQAELAVWLHKGDSKRVVLRAALAQLERRP